MLASSAGRSSRSVSVSRAGSIAASRRANPPSAPDLLVDRRTTEVLEQVVMKVDAVECRVGGMDLMEPREVLVDEVRQGFGGIHSGRICGPRMSGILYVVATPIGNLEDVTLRALRILREVSLIAAEDTRRTARLLQHYSISTPTTSLHEHNERRQTPPLIARLCPAGNPLRSCRMPARRSSRIPVESLVAAARAAGVRVESIPGPSAVMAALSAAGLPTERVHIPRISTRLGQKTARHGSRRWPPRPEPWSSSKRRIGCGQRWGILSMVIRPKQTR